MAEYDDADTDANGEAAVLRRLYAVKLTEQARLVWGHIADALKASEPMWAALEQKRDAAPLAAVFPSSVLVAWSAILDSKTSLLRVHASALRRILDLDLDLGHGYGHGLAADIGDRLACARARCGWFRSRGDCFASALNRHVAPWRVCDTTFVRQMDVERDPVCKLAVFDAHWAWFVQFFSSRAEAFVPRVRAEQARWPFHTVNVKGWLLHDVQGSLDGNAFKDKFPTARGLVRAGVDVNSVNCNCRPDEDSASHSVSVRDTFEPLAMVVLRAAMDETMSAFEQGLRVEPDQTMRVLGRLCEDPCLNHYSDVSNCRNEHDETLLHVATHFRRTDVMRYLLGNQPALRTRVDRLGNTPMHLVCQGSSLAVDYYCVDAFELLLGHTRAACQGLSREASVGVLTACNQTGMMPVHMLAQGFCETFTTRTMLHEILNVCGDGVHTLRTQTTGETMYHCLAQNEDGASALRTLFHAAHRANVEDTFTTVDVRGNTMLHVAAHARLHLLDMIDALPPSLVRVRNTAGKLPLQLWCEHAIEVESADHPDPAARCVPALNLGLGPCRDNTSAAATTTDVDDDDDNDDDMDNDLLDRTNADRTVRSRRNHPAYVQRLAWFTRALTVQDVTDARVDTTLKDLVFFECLDTLQQLLTFMCTEEAVTWLRCVIQEATFQFDPAPDADAFGYPCATDISLLHIAVYNALHHPIERSLDMVRLLLEYGADPWRTDADGHTVFKYLADARATSTVRPRGVWDDIEAACRRAAHEHDMSSYKGMCLETLVHQYDAHKKRLTDADVAKLRLLDKEADASCAITQTLMLHPVRFCGDGKLYESSYIRQWIRTQQQQGHRESENETRTVLSPQHGLEVTDVRCVFDVGDTLRLRAYVIEQLLDPAAAHVDRKPPKRTRAQSPPTRRAKQARCHDKG